MLGEVNNAPVSGQISENNPSPTGAMCMLGGYVIISMPGLMLEATIAVEKYTATSL